MKTESKEIKTSFWNSISFKLMVIVLLSFILLIPSSMVKNLIRERSQRNREAISEITDKWGMDQTITGPVLQLPYQINYSLSNGEVETKTNYFYVFPSNLEISGDIRVTEKHRSIYEVLLYTSELRIEGSFKNEDFSDWPERMDKILWEDARLIVGLSDLKGITQMISLKWNDTDKIKLSPGTSTCNFLSRGINAIVNVSNDSANSFALNLKINGSGKLYFSPVANQTSINLKANWGHPSFDGAFLPETSNIQDTSFSANWQTSEMTRTYPQILSSENNQSALNLQDTGVELIYPVDTYQKATRSVKYALLFIALTFLVMFFTEITGAKKIHPIQYLIVGIALVIFYSLLIALAEHMNFNYAFLIGSITIVAMNTVYIHSIYKNMKTSIIIGLTMGALYVYLFTILQIADYALLLGNIGLVLILALVMVFSRKVDWYSTKKIISDKDEEV